MVFTFPKDFSPDAIRAWIVKASAEIGTNPTQLAKRAKVAPSTVNKFLADTGNKTRSLNSKTIQALIAAARDIQAARYNTFQPLAVEEDDDEQAPRTAIVVEIPVIDASTITKDLDLKASFHVSIPVPANYTVSDRLFGLQVDQSIASQTFPLGTLLIVDGHHTFFRQQPVMGERVVVGEERGSEHLSLSIRELITGPSGDNWLVGVPPGKSRLADLYLGRNVTETPDHTHILGRVILSLQPEPSVYGALVATA